MICNVTVISIKDNREDKLLECWSREGALWSATWMVRPDVMRH